MTTLANPKAPLGWGIDKNVVPAGVGLYYDKTNCLGIGTMDASGDLTIAAKGLSVADQATIGGGLIGKITLRDSAAAAWGFIGDGATDNSPALAAWVAELAGASGGLRFPSGIFVFASLSTINFAVGQSITLEGMGAATEFRVQGAHGFIIANYSQRVVAANPNAGVLEVNGLRLTTDQAQTQTAIRVNGANVAGATVPATRFEALTLEGASAVQEWGIGIDISDTTVVHFNRIVINAATLGAGATSIGINIAGTSIVEEPAAYKIHELKVTRGGTGIKASGNLEGIFVTSSALAGQNVGIDVQTAPGRPQLFVIGNHINAIQQCIHAVNVVQCNLSDNLLYQGFLGGMPANSPMIELNAVGTSTISRNLFRASATLGSSPDGIKFIGSTFNTISDNVMIGNNLVMNFDAASGSNSGRNNNVSGQTTVITDDATTNSIEFAIGGSMTLYRAGIKLLVNNRTTFITEAPILDISYVGLVPVSGQTVTMANETDVLILEPAGALAALTVTLPDLTATYDGKHVKFMTTQAITVLTVNALSGTVMNAPTTAAAGQGFQFFGNGINGKWYRMQ